MYTLSMIIHISRCMLQTLFGMPVLWLQPDNAHANSNEQASTFQLGHAAD